MSQVGVGHRRRLPQCAIANSSHAHTCARTRVRARAARQRTIASISTEVCERRICLYHASATAASPRIPMLTRRPCCHSAGSQVRSHMQARAACALACTHVRRVVRSCSCPRLPAYGAVEFRATPRHTTPHHTTPHHTTTTHHHTSPHHTTHHHTSPHHTTPPYVCTAFKGGAVVRCGRSRASSATRVCARASSVVPCRPTCPVLAAWCACVARTCLHARDEIYTRARLVV